MTILSHEPQILQATTVESEFGIITICWSDIGLCRVAFGAMSDPAHAGSTVTTADSPRLNHDQLDLCRRIGRLLRGLPEDLTRVPLDLSGRTPFQRDVLAACQSIPWGETCSYAELATAAGRPGAARAVGNVMRSNATPLVVPCHRVVCQSGSLGGFSAPGGVGLKRRLLQIEQRE